MYPCATKYLDLDSHVFITQFFLLQLYLCVLLYINLTASKAIYIILVVYSQRYAYTFALVVYWIVILQCIPIIIVI